MNDKLKFYTMTRPIKFRRVRILRRKLWNLKIKLREVLRKRKYYYYQFLSKIRYVQRVTNCETTSTYYSLGESYQPLEIHSKYVTAKINVCIERVNRTDVDYYKRHNKILYINKSYNKDYYYLLGTLKDIILNIFDTSVAVDSDNKVFSTFAYSAENRKGFVEKRIDVSNLVNLKYKYAVGFNNLDNIDWNIIDRIYDEFRRYFYETPLEQYVKEF